MDQKRKFTDIDETEITSDYNFRKRQKIKYNLERDDDPDYEYESTEESVEIVNEDSGSDSESESECDETIDSDDIPNLDDDDDDDDDEKEEDNSLIPSNHDLDNNLQKSILKKMINEINEIDNFDLDEYLTDLEDKIDSSENKKHSVIEMSAINVSNRVIKNLIAEIRFEYDVMRGDFDIITYLESRIKLIDDMNALPPMPIKFVKIDPLKFLATLLTGKRGEEEYDEDEDEDYVDEEETPKKKGKLSFNKQFSNFLKNGIITPKDNMSYFKKLSEDDKKKYIDGINKIKEQYKVDKPKILKILESDMHVNNKTVILNKLQNFSQLNPYSSGFFKMKKWVDSITQIPFGVYKKPPVSLDSPQHEITTYLSKVGKHMDDAVYGHTKAKKQILQLIAHTISNPKEGGSILAIQGPPGVGKTQLIQDGISKALGRPFEFISLGGATDSSFLQGHSYTWEGSTCGMIINVLKSAQCMNPVIFFDELDKVSQSHRGNEIINILTHLTDSTQNHHFNDKYYAGIDFDLSKAIFIFSFNDEHKINRILKDRMYIIRTEGFQVNEKLKIANKYLVPRIMDSVGFGKDDIIFKKDVLKYIIDTYTFEGGVRRLKECVLEITKEINLRSLNGEKILGKKVNFPIYVNKKMLSQDIFKDRHKIVHDLIHDEPKVGLVNGLWANEYGVGGIIPIETFKIPTATKLQLDLTGMQGDVMKESMRVAKTVAWNIIPDNVKQKLGKSWKEFGNTGIHIHCPDGSTPKDGPSAGTAITIAIISLLMNIPFNNKMAMTGEINLRGEVKKIGGLHSKLNGAKKAGIEKVLIPVENMDDLKKIKEEHEDLFSKNFEVVPVNNIWEVLKLSFINLDIKTIKKY